MLPRQRGLTFNGQVYAVLLLQQYHGERDTTGSSRKEKSSSYYGSRSGQECVSLEFYGTPIITLPRNSVACLLPKTYVRFPGEPCSIRRTDFLPRIRCRESQWKASKDLLAKTQEFDNGYVYGNKYVIGSVSPKKGPHVSTVLSSVWIGFLQR